MNKLIKPLDLLLIAAVLLCCAGLLIYMQRSTAGATAVITLDGAEYAQIDLEKVEESYETELPCEPKVVLLIEKGAISFYEADCKDKVCIRSGKLTRRGEAAACLPAKVVVGIRNGEASEIDALVY